MAQVRRGETNHYLGLYENREAAESAVAEFREENPSTRLRKLESVRRNHVRCYDEETLLAQRARIVDVIESGVKPLIKITTASGKMLRCTADHAVFTPEGWLKAGELTVGDAVMVAGTAPRPSQALIPPSLRRGIGVWTSMQRQRLIKDVDACHVCGEEFPRDQLALDHVVPVAGDLTLALDERNLAPACEPCHAARSGDEQALAQRGGKIAKAVPDPVVAIEADGEEMTYDLSVEGPWHNFLANGIVVHNSYNEESGRYRELQPVFYVPGESRKLVQQGRPGKYVFVEGTEVQQELVSRTLEDSYRQAYEAYQEMLAAACRPRGRPRGPPGRPVLLHVRHLQRPLADALPRPAHPARTGDGPVLPAAGDRDGGREDGGRVGEAHAPHLRRLQRQRPCRAVTATIETSCEDERRRRMYGSSVRSVRIAAFREVHLA